MEVWRRVVGYIYFPFLQPWLNTHNIAVLRGFPPDKDFKMEEMQNGASCRVLKVSNFRLAFAFSTVYEQCSPKRRQWRPREVNEDLCG